MLGRTTKFLLCFYAFASPESAEAQCFLLGRLSVLLSIRSFVVKSCDCEHDILKKNEPILLKIGGTSAWSVRQGDKAFNFGG